MQEDGAAIVMGVGQDIPALPGVAMTREQAATTSGMVTSAVLTDL